MGGFMKRSQYKFYYKLITFFCLLSTIPVILVGLFSYEHSQKTAISNVSEEKLDTLQQTQLSIEHILKTVDHSLTHYVSSPPLLRTLSEPLHSDQFQIYDQVNQELNYLQSFDTDLSNMTLVSYMKNWYMNNSGLYRMNTDSLHKAAEAYSKKQASRSYWTLEKNNRMISTKEGTSESCRYNINLIKQLPLNSTNTKGLAAASIPSCSLVKNMPDYSSANSVFIIDEKGRIILHNNMSDIGDSLQNDDFVKKMLTQSSKSGQFETVIDRIHYKVTYQKSDYNTWTYFSLVSLPELKKEAKSIGWITFTVCFVLLTLSLLFSWLGSRHFYKPIRLLYESFARHGAFPEKQPHQNEFELIEQSFKQLKNRNDDLEETMRQQATHLQQYFMVRLMLGKLTEEEVNNRFESLGLKQNWRHLALLVLQIDTLNQTPYEKKDMDLLLFAVNSLIERNIPAEKRLAPAVVDKQQATILMNESGTKETFMAELNDTARMIQDTVEAELHLSVSIGVSQPFDALAMAKNAYAEGLEALKYRLKAENKSIIFYEDLDQKKTFKTHFPKQLQHELFDAVKAGDKEKADKCLHAILQSMFTHNTNPYQFQIAIARFLNHVIELMHVLGIELFELEENKMLYDQIFELKTFEDTENWLKQEFIDPMTDKVNARADAQYKNISDNIIHIIHHEFESDLTLDEIARRLHYNPNYLSSIFKKEMGISFSEYVSNYRHHMAKSWLAESDMAVKDIAEKLKYKNSQNFIRSFKKLEGITPGSYRQQKRSI
ncbi:helix-turn-helix domain-containing protein [Bacillus halotolerans]|uniref:helix-turn-helix domain-containing protein n=1 Tax=Bacillus halotolerans TaxID=260554 RepID=UPI001C003BC9|nr:helix-turn-helix domain-containing protein [Bacillus halotolerans]MBT9249279.1 helix-turn-helix domain-containing protein [Bacillus halotolerans]MDL5613144.1 helix-turn-helix domain-containing protein [Bacillus halotolerans]